MYSITIAIAQTPSIKADIKANIKIHSKYIKKATQAGANLILFPELSLTGYEPKLSQKCSILPNDSCLKTLQQQAVQNNIIILAGAPVPDSGGKSNIANLCFFPDGSIDTHTKRYLHPGEEEYFVPGNHQIMISTNNHKIAQAICADFTNPQHSHDAAQNGATLYLAGAFITPKGYDKDAEILQSIATKYKIPVFLANHSEKTGGFDTAGKSAVWDNQGTLLVQIPDTRNALIIAALDQNKWQCNIIDVNINNQE